MSGYDNPAPQDNEKSIVHWVKQMYESSKNSKEKFQTIWKEAYQFYKGNQWPSNRSWSEDTSWRSDVVVNACFATVETIVPLYIEANPRVFVYPKKIENEEQAKILEKVKDHIWEITEMPLRLSTTGRNVSIYGTSIFHVSWDEKRDDLRVDVISPRNFFPDPDATDIDECQFVIWARPVSMFQIKQRWPDRAHLVIAEEVEPDIEKPEGGPSQEVDAGGVQSPTSRALTVNVTGGEQQMTSYSKAGDQAPHYQRKRTTLYEVWVHDESTEQTIDQMTGEVVEQPKYPNGRRLFVAGDTLLEDGPNPYEHGMFPFVRVINYELDECFWGMGDVEQLIPLQKELNKSKALFMDHRNLMGQPQWLYEEGSVEEGKISNKPGAKIAYRAVSGKAPEKVPPGNMPNWMFRLAEGTNMDIESVSGIHDATRGRVPKGAESGRAIIALQEKDLTRIKKKSMYLEQALKQLSYLVLKTAQELYEPETKTIRIVGESMRGGIQMLGSDALDVDFDISVEMGSTLPHNPEADMEAIVKLLEMGTIPPEEALPLLAPMMKIAGIQRLSDKLQAEIEQQKQMEQMQMQGGPPQGPPTGGM